MSDSPSIVETSVVVQTVARVVRGSLIGRGIAAVIAPVRRYGERAERSLSRRFPGDADADARVTALLRDNRLFRFVVGVCESVEGGWRSSAAVALLQPLADDLRAGGAPYVVRLIGWTMLVAGVAYRAMVGFRDPLLTRGFVVAWGLELLCGVVLIAGAGPIGAAWRTKIAKLDRSGTVER